MTPTPSEEQVRAAREFIESEFHEYENILYNAASHSKRLASLLRTVRAQAVEECAKVAEEYKLGPRDSTSGSSTQFAIAAALRSRGEGGGGRVILQVLECQYGEWPHERWVVPAGWWASTVERGRWSACCRIRWWHLAMIVFGIWPKGTGTMREPNYWPMRVVLRGRVIWRSDAALSRGAREEEGK